MADVSNDYEASENEVGYLVTERDFVSLLIDLYRERPSLWKTKHPQYLDKLTRAKALQEIVQELQVYKPDYNEDMVKKKINTLRTNFNKMRHKFIENKQAGVTFKPNLWYYNQLLFLLERGNPTNASHLRVSSVHSDIGHDPEQENDQSGEISESNEQEVKYYPQEQEYEESEPDPPVTTKRQTRNFKNVVVKRRRVNPKPQEQEKESKEETPANEQYMTITTTYYKKPETKEDLLAKSWAMTLKKLSPSQKMFAEKIIHDVLFEAQQGNLTKNGVSFCPSF